MTNRCVAFLAGVLLASAAAGETIYKYRAADGRMTYSNRLLPGAELIETFDYRFAAPAAADPNAAKAGAAVNERMKVHLTELEKAWSEVQDARSALASAEARLTGVEPLDEEGRSLAGPSSPAPPPVGGPRAPAVPAAGGAAPAASPAVGGAMGARRGGGRSAEYRDRKASLEAEVQAARTRLDTALRSYNQLR
jgi:hypothetical protein